MKTIPFENGDRMPALGLGTWQAAPGEVGNAVREAIRLGYRHIDCARIYRNESEIGAAFHAAFQADDIRRNDLWVTSKLWNNCHQPEHVRPALVKTLSNLQLDTLDLYLMHWPMAVRHDKLIPETGEDLIPPEECSIVDTWQAMEALRDEGLCRHIGVSNFSLAKLDQIRTQCGSTPEVNQIELHPYLQQNAMLEFCREHGTVLTAYSPLGSPARPEGMREDDEPVLLEDPGVAEVAARRGCTPAQALIAWALQRGTSVIPKSTNTERLQQNLDAAAIELTEEDMAVFAGLDKHRRYIDGAIWAMPGSPWTPATVWDE